MTNQEIKDALYKLTDEKGQTRNKTQWGENVTHAGTGKGDLCGPGWIHAYTDPLVAVFLNPIHANFKNPRLWEAHGDVERDDRLKVGCQSLTTLREIALPVLTTAQRVRCAILCAQSVLQPGSLSAWEQWAEQWLQGKNRTKAAAAAAAWVARGAAAAWVARGAAEVAAAAAEVAAAAAEVAAAAAAEVAAEVAVEVAVEAARAAARAAAWAEAAARAAEAASFDLSNILRKAIAEEGK